MLLILSSRVVTPLQENKHKRYTTIRKQTQTVHHYKKTHTHGTPLQENKHKRYTITRKQTQTVHHYKKTNTNGTPLQENKHKRYTTTRKQTQTVHHYKKTNTNQVNTAYEHYSGEADTFRDLYSNFTG